MRLVRRVKEEMMARVRMAPPDGNAVMNMLLSRKQWNSWAPYQFVKHAKMCFPDMDYQTLLGIYAGDLEHVDSGDGTIFLRPVQHKE